MDAVDTIGHELAILFDSWRCELRAVAAEVAPAVEFNGFLILARLSEAGPVRLTDIANHYGVGKATMSRQIKALEQLGLIERQAAPDDARATLLALTDRGTKQLAEVWQAVWEWRRARLASWEPEQVAALATLLGRFNATCQP